MDIEFSYYVDTDWFPINEVKSERYKIGISQITKPEIVGVKGCVYQISDPYLFYCDTVDTYEYYVYYIETDNCKFRIAKYRPLNRGLFKMCVKSNSSRHPLLDNLIKNASNSFNVFKRFSLDNFYTYQPVFLNTLGGTFCDIISSGNNVMLSLGNSKTFLKIGVSSFDFRAKSEVKFGNIINVNIFDIYQINGNYLREKYEARYNRLNYLTNENYVKYSSIIKVEISKITVPDQKTESLLIVDNNQVSYMLWNMHNSVRVKIHNFKLLLQDGYIDYDNTTYANGTAVLTNNIIKPAYDIQDIDKISTYYAKPVDVDVLLKRDKKMLENYEKRKICRAYASGKTLLVSNDPFIKNGEIKVHSISPIKLTSLTEMAEYNTIILDNVQSQCPPGKTIIQFGNSTNIIAGGIKTFVFLLGTVGSGKSVLVKKIQHMIHCTGPIDIMQIDKLIETDIEYINETNQDVYHKLRKHYDVVMNAQICASIDAKHSIILETTRIDPQYAQSIKLHGYYIVGVIVNNTYENISNNIKIRNQTKMRKTSLTVDDYNTFYNTVPDLAKKYCDTVIYIDQNNDSSSNI